MTWPVFVCCKVRHKSSSKSCLLFTQKLLIDELNHLTFDSFIFYYLLQVPKKTSNSLIYLSGNYLTHFVWSVTDCRKNLTLERYFCLRDTQPKWLPLKRSRPCAEIAMTKMTNIIVCLYTYFVLCETANFSKFKSIIPWLKGKTIRE